jgi:hypothetical protein
MEIKKSQLRKIIKEQVSAFFVTPEPLGTVSRSKSIDTALRGHGFKSNDSEVNEKELDRAIQLTMRDLEAGAASRMRSKPMDEARKLPHAPAAGYKGRAKVNKKEFIKKVQSLVPKNKAKSFDMKQLNNLYDSGSSPEDAAKELMGEAKKKPVKGYDRIKRPPQVGDKVHIGHAQKGGAGVEGKVTKIAGRVVYITNDAGKTYKGPLKNTAIMEISGVDSLKPNDPHTPEDEAEKDAADDVMEAGPEKKGGRPRGGPHIENIRFWDLEEKSLRYIIKDASEAVKANPTARKAGKWADEINDAVTVLYWRKKKGIKEEYIQLVVTEGFKVGTKISKVLAQSSTIKMANPKDPRWIFAIVSRFGSKGVTSAAAQDNVSMVVVDKAGKVIKDWGSHLNAKAALKFAQSKGYTKKIDESQAVMEAEKEGKRITALRNILKGHTAGKIDGQIVDAFTAGGLVKLYDQLDKKNHPKFERLPLLKLVDFMWKQVRR